LDYNPKIAKMGWKIGWCGGWKGCTRRVEKFCANFGRKACVWNVKFRCFFARKMQRRI